jgi:TonB family protein
MTGLILRIALAISGSLAASILVKATLILTVGLLCAGCAPRSRAALRHAALAACFGVLLLLPLASIAIPPLRVFLSPAFSSSAKAGPLRNGSSGRPVAISINNSVAPRPAQFSRAALATTAWIAGAALFLLPVFAGLWQVQRLRRSAVKWSEGQQALEALAPGAGVRRRVDVLLHAKVAGPMTCGVLRPAIVLPQDAQTWEQADLHRALIHELEHVRRVDFLSHCLARAACALYWFHPLVWVAWRKLELEAERSCDDAVLARSEATAYADQLVGLARRLSAAAKSPALAMANRADLSKRVAAVLDSRQSRGRAGRLAIALACVGALAVAMTLSPMRMVAAPQLAPPAQFISTTSLVALDVFVVGKDGKTLEGLQPSDFAVTEDGVLQGISVFEFDKRPDGSLPGFATSSDYVLGYYARNPNLDGRFRKIGVALTSGVAASLDYRAGYYGNRQSGGLAAAGDRAVPRPEGSPAPIFVPQPTYSDEARKAKFQGSALLQAEIDAAGKVTSVEVVRRLGLGLDEKAVEAVKQWLFRPGMRNGQPVASQAQVRVDFRLL